MKLATASTAVFFLAIASPAFAQDEDTNRCAALAERAIAGGRIEAAVLVRPDDRQPIEAFGVPPLPAGASYCRVSTTLTPTTASSIRSEVWLPLPTDWNGKLLAVGNGGYGGSLGGPRLAMRPAVRQGYVVAGTDMGHVEDGSDGKNAEWALNQPDLIVDFAYRANHLTAVLAKELALAFYGRAHSHAYFQGCSDGGREALMAVQRYPEDFDGVIAGAPANAWPRLMTSFAWTWKVAHERSESRLTPANLAYIQSAVMAKCDELDGIKDGVIDDPRQCRFDPAVVECDKDPSTGCLTAPQLLALRALYQGPRHPGSGQSIMPGFTPGGEGLSSGWDLWITGTDAQQPAFARSFYANFVFNDPAWTMADFDLEAAFASGEAAMGDIIASDEVNLSAFASRGGKLILHHGWVDAAIPAEATITYYEAVRAEMGEAVTDDFLRLFMAPGVGHCFGGPGPSNLPLLEALDVWVETDSAPNSIIASKYANDYAPLLGLPTGDPVRQRPVCAWPQVATWTREGSSDDPAVFTCQAPLAPTTERR